jgi:hypothetical protein
VDSLDLIVQQEYPLALSPLETAPTQIPNFPLLPILNVLGNVSPSLASRSTAYIVVLGTLIEYNNRRHSSNGVDSTALSTSFSDFSVFFFESAAQIRYLFIRSNNLH